MSALAVSGLGWLSLACALGAIATYVFMVTRGQGVVRLLNGLGLFLTGLALFQGPAILRAAEGDTNVFLAVLLLNLAVIAQAAAVVRHRPIWDGKERREASGGTSA